MVPSFTFENPLGVSAFTSLRKLAAAVDRLFLCVVVRCVVVLNLVGTAPGR